MLKRLLLNILLKLKTLRMKLLLQEISVSLTKQEALSFYHEFSSVLLEAEEIQRELGVR